MKRTGWRVAVWLLALAVAGWSIGDVAWAQYGPPQPYQGPPPGMPYGQPAYVMPPGGQPPVLMAPPGSGPPQGFNGQPGGGPAGFMGPGGGPPGFMGPGGGPRGEGRWGRGRGGSPEERAARIEGFLRRFDKNNDGRIENSELTDQERMFLEGMAQRSGMKVEYPVSIDEVKKALSQRGGRDREGGGPQGGGAPGGAPAAPAAPPKVAGFGVQAKATPVAGFGASAGANNPKPAASPGPARVITPAPAANGGGPVPDPGQDRAQRENGRLRRLAELNIRRLDKNKNGQLDRDEWAAQQARYGPADGNGDGTITLDEMNAWLGAYGGGQGNRRERADVEVASAAYSSDSSGRRSYRFRSAVERLPEGLPPWFSQRDANADGQVSMAEYASFWSDSVVAEFTQYDLNGDGIITPRECLRGH
ncbi:MAG: hypothetical protein JW809_19025 [Pirellulales bacterium]|nr:hypothetical protein [Pirellulales bacterium]